MATATHDRPRVDRTGLALGAALLAMVLVTGLIFTFSAAVMPNLAGANDRTFVATMQRFNDNPVFALTFTVALVLAVLAVVVHRRHGPASAVRWTIGAVILYGIVFAVTSVVHVPLNYEIDEVAELDSVAKLADVRDRVEIPWVVGNIVRTLLSIAAVGALARSLLLHGRTATDRARRSGATAPTTPTAWAPPATTPRQSSSTSDHRMELPNEPSCRARTCSTSRPLPPPTRLRSPWSEPPVDASVASMALPEGWTLKLRAARAHTDDRRP